MPPKKKGLGKGTTTSRTSPKKNLEAAYLRGVVTGKFYDVVLYAYSCKTPSGVVCKPRPVYANSLVLESESGYFQSLLGSSFAENKVTSIDDGFPENKPSFTRDYDYDCDSDLESIAEDSFDSENPSSNTSDQPKRATQAQEPSEPTLSAVSKSQAKDTNTRRTPPTRAGRIILIPNIAFATLRFVVSHLISENPTFLPLKSSGKPRVSLGTLEGMYEGNAPCSPKSAYRAADMLQLESMRYRAAESIKSQLCENNILEEIFSFFTSNYDEIIEMQIEYLSKQGASRHVMECLPLWIAKVSAGSIPYSNIIITKLVGLWLDKGKNNSGENPIPTAQTQTGPQWTGWPSSLGKP